MIFIKKEKILNLFIEKTGILLNILSVLHKSNYTKYLIFKTMFFGVSLVWNTSPSYKQLLNRFLFFNHFFKLIKFTKSIEALSPSS